MGKMAIMTLPDEEPSSIQTRSSLLGRLREGDDVESWSEFYRVYGNLIRLFALKAGLSEGEAEEIVQETAIGVARHLPEFTYDPKVCKFKTWLFQHASWRVQDFFRRRKRIARGVVESGSDGVNELAEQVEDPNSKKLTELFESEWRSHMLQIALERLTEKFTLKQIQLFELLVVQGWSASDVARVLDLSIPNVYVTKHRVSAAVQRELRRLERSVFKS